MKKKAWIKIVEAFIAILLVAGILLFFVTMISDTEKINFEIYDLEKEVLRYIQTNQTLRNIVLGVSSLPAEGDEIDQKLIIGVNETIPDYLICELKICEVYSNCLLTQEIEKDVYSQYMIFSSNLTQYTPKKAKLFCWIK